jgi:hypothetical protein
MWDGEQVLSRKRDKDVASIESTYSKAYDNPRSKHVMFSKY